ncbi:hypothetical protein C483_15507 [Natrialba hulunbeirensis JCM 10989]|uniref:Uncharacterized protein n=1 Tax=Natrialba hulunbeirensis JCM 10989 TaxID=1227493 RepID=L9ZQH1_9EURY|nr:hypothetical protein [Natrialba hulunbeirensis]ELY88755.1 hypothetical protein C483_15507 [Natrialba hulunbeirensis JCM 10989]
MTTVQDDTGKRYLLLKRSEHASLVRDPQTGDECYVQNDRLDAVDAADELDPVAQAVSSPVRTLLTTVHDEATLSLLISLADEGPLDIRTILDSTTLCESDLHGRLTILTGANLLAETDVGGERGYRLTDTCEAALETIRFDLDESAAASDPDTDTDTDTNTNTNTDERSDSSSSSPTGSTSASASTSPSGPTGTLESN